MQRIFIVLSVLCLILLSGCQTQQTTPHPQAPAAPALQVSPKNWKARGRIGVFTKEQGGSLGFQWKQQGQDYTLRFIGPTGSQTAVLTAKNKKIHFAEANGYTAHSTHPEQLLEERFGWSVPLSGLRYWIVGAIDPTRPITQFANTETGALETLEQDGWKIKFENYIHDGPYTLPKRLTLLRSSPQISVKLAITAWEIP